MTVSDSLVRELASYRGDPLVTSLYLDVDGRRYPRAVDYEANLGRLFRVARTQAEAMGSAAAAAVEADLEQVREWFGTGIDRSRTRGVAVFCCDAQGLFRALTLPVAVHDQVSLGPAPELAQLAAVLEQADKVLVVLADQQGSRFLHLELGEVHEQPGVVDPTERQVDTDVELGSWEHRHEEEARRHLRRVASEADDETARWHANRLVLGGPAGAVEELERHLPSDTRNRVAGRVTVALSASTDEIAEAALEVVRQAEARDQERLVEELTERAARGAAGVTGLADTLEAVSDRRVKTLLVSRGLASAGARCPACGRLATSTQPCPRCGAATGEVDDVVADAIEEVFAQRASVAIYDGTELEAVGGIGALERY